MYSNGSSGNNRTGSYIRRYILSYLLCSNHTSFNDLSFFYMFHNSHCDEESLRRGANLPYSDRAVFRSFQNWGNSATLFLLVYKGWVDVVISRNNYVMMSKQRPSWISHLGFLDYSKTSEKPLKKSLKNGFNVLKMSK